MAREDYPEGCAIHVKDVKPARVGPGTGWQNVDIRFVVGSEVAGPGNLTWWRTLFTPGATHHKHRHNLADEVFYVIRGRAAQGIGTTEYEVTPGVSVFIPRGATHWLRTLEPNEPVEVVGVYVGGSTVEESGYEYVGPVSEVDKKLR
ncbi:MAG: cupin domain-containing protein [Bacillota bacterium]|nr:MAG: cupin domain-containing protein [Bacillota bacterium]